MSTVVLASHECGFRGRYDSRARAEYALARHSCEKTHRDRAATRRGRVRDAAVDRTPKPCLHKRARHVHGTYTTYTLDRCRCVPCSVAASAYNNDLRRRNTYGRSNLVDAGPVRAHIAALREAGIGLKQLTALGVASGGELTKLVYGVSRGDGTHRPPARRVHVEIAQRILAVTATVDSVAGGVRVDPTGTFRRLQALIALGWSVQRLADTHGLNRQPLDHALAGRPVTAATARAISAVYEALWDQPPPQDTTGDRIAAVRARNRARAAGWAPPMAWDDDAIDDPTATPADPAPEETPGVDHAAIARALAGVPVALTRAERWIALEELVVHGLDDHQIATRLHTTAHTVLRDRQYLGIPSPRRTAA